MIIMKKINLIFFLCLHFAVGEIEHDAVKVQKRAFTAVNIRKDQELFQREDFNALEKISIAPYAVALIAQIVLVSAEYKNDFALECPLSGCKHMEYPSSFKASLLQMSFSAYRSFNKAHVNMDEIEMLTRMIPIEVRNAVMTLIRGSDVEIELLLPLQLNSIKEIATSARVLATESVDNSIRLLETTNELRDAIHKLNEFNGATATLKEIISQLQEALETLHTLREKWLLEFFQKMELMIDTSMGKFNDVAKYIEQGRDIKVREPLSSNFKNLMYEKIQMAMTSAYLVNRMSAVYVDISAEYIMPPVRKLGIMMETKDPNEITKLKIQIKEQAEKANAKITRKIKEEKRTFDSEVKKRLADIEAFYKPVFDQIPQARKSELEALSAEATHAISEVALIYENWNWKLFMQRQQRQQRQQILFQKMN